MAVKRFDPDDALDLALAAFWAHGYEATSAQDLVDAMGINRGSLYDTFGSKPQLYVRALDRYRERTHAGLVEALPASGGLPALRRYLHRQAAALADDPLRRGCLLTNACTEMAARDPAVHEVVSDAMRATHDVLRGAVEAAQDRGELRPDLDPAGAADLLLTMLHGMRVLGRAGADRRRLGQTVDLTLDALG